MRSGSAALARITAWSTAPAGARRIYVVAAAIGLATYLLVYGPGHLLGTSAYWEMPTTDERAYLMGYRYFLLEPWHWPVFASHGIDVPFTKSIAFQDAIPIWALLNKTLATLIPPWRSFSAHAYLGLWHAVVYALQACFGVAILRELGHRSWRQGIVTALFFVALPPWIFRYGHAALSAHWLELWAIYLYLRTPARGAPPRALGLGWLAQLTVASLVNPYHATMSFGVFLASLLRSRHARTIVTWLPLGLGCIVGALWFAGYFAHELRVPQWGFEVESANALSWLVPVRSGILGDGRWIANTLATPWQYEGYAYLGLGMLVLLALYLPRARSLGRVISRHRFLFAFVVGCCVLALSNHIYVGSHELGSYRIPWFLRFIPHQFRSPGRFVWVPFYTLVVFLLHQAFTRFSAGRGFAVVVLALGIQLVDVRPEWELQRTWASGPQNVTLDLGAWRALVHAHGAVFVHPTYTCITGDAIPRLSEISTELQMLASERAIPINGTYSARPTRDCAAEERAWPALEAAPDALYVVLPPAAAIARRLEAAGVPCRAFDDGRACSRNVAALAEATRAGIVR